MPFPQPDRAVSHNHTAAPIARTMYCVNIIIVTILSSAMFVPYLFCTEGAQCVYAPALRVPPTLSPNTVSSRTADPEGRTHQVSLPPLFLSVVRDYPDQMSVLCCLKACKEQLLSCFPSGLTPTLTCDYSSQSTASFQYQNTNVNTFTPQTLTSAPSPCYRPSTLVKDMGELVLHLPCPGTLLEIYARSLPDLSFTHFVDTRAIPFEDECSIEVVTKGSLIPGSDHLRYVSTHIHGRPSLSNSFVFARPAKNLASDLNGRPPIRPGGRGKAPHPRSSSPSLRGRGGRGGRRPPSPHEFAPAPVSASFLASRINMAIGSISSSSRSISPNQIIFKAFDRNGLPDDAQLQQSGPTTFFLQLDANSNPEAVAALCNCRTLHFPLHPDGRPLSHKNWIFENPVTSDIGPAVSENHTVYITFGVSPALTTEQIDMGIQPSPEIPLLWDCDEFLANKKLRTVTLFLHMAAAAAVEENHPFHRTKQICESLLPLWHFSFVRLLGLPQDKHPSLNLMDYFCLAAQTNSLHSASSLADFSPVHLPIVTDQCDIPLAVFNIYISLDNPADAVEESTGVSAEEEQNFRNHSIQLSCQVPVDPEFIVNAWSTEVLKRIQSLVTRDSETQTLSSSLSNKAEDNILPALKDVSSIELLRVNASVNVQVPKPYRVDPRHSTGNRTKLLSVAPANPRVVQFALSPRGSSRLQILPPSTSVATSSPVSLFVGTTGVRLRGAPTAISLPPTSNRAKRLAALKEMEAVLSPHHPINVAGTPPPVPQHQAPTYASLFHKPATPLVPQHHHQTQGSNPLFIQNPTNMEYDAPGQHDANQVCQQSCLPTFEFSPHNKSCILEKHQINNITYPSPPLCDSKSCFSSNSLSNNNSRVRWRYRELQKKLISCTKSCRQQTKTETPQLQNWLQSRPPTTPRRLLISFSLVGPTLLILLPANLAARVQNAHTGAWRRNCTHWRLHSKKLSLYHASMPQASHRPLFVKALPQDLSPPASQLSQSHNLQVSLHPLNLVHQRILQTRKSRSLLIQKQENENPRITIVTILSPSAKHASAAHPYSRGLIKTQPTVTANILLPCHCTLTSKMLCLRICSPNNDVHVTTTCSLKLHPQMLFDACEITKTVTPCYHLKLLTHRKANDRPYRALFTLDPGGTILVSHTLNGRMRQNRTMTNQRNVTKVPCFHMNAPDPRAFSLPKGPPHCNNDHQNITLTSLILPPQIIIAYRMLNIILAPTLFYTNPTYLATLVLRIGQIEDKSPIKFLQFLVCSVLLNLCAFYSLISTLHSIIIQCSSRKLCLHSSRQSSHRCSSAQIKTWLNTLPDRFGSTILSPLYIPWPNRSILMPQWRPALLYTFATHKAHFKISKQKWNKYVRSKNKAYIHELSYILQAIIPYTITMSNTPDLPTHLTTNTYSGILVSTCIRLSSLAACTLILALISDPRKLLLMLLMCAGDIHPNPGPPSISPTLLSKYYSSTPIQLTSWIRNQNYQTLHFGDPNGQPYSTRSDMLSGFFQEYLDKSDQTNLLSKFLKHVYLCYPNLSQTNVKVVRAAEEHDMQRGQTPFNWLNPQQTTRALSERAKIMHDPLNCAALVIPRVANAHFTTYIFHSDGVAYYDSLSFPPDISLVSKYHESLNSFYLSNPHLATPVIRQTLAKIISSPPERMPCTQQSPEANPWSCGYCSANVCIQAVLQQAVPSINQPLIAIYKLQSAYLKHKITGQNNVWEEALHVLLSEPPSPSTYDSCPTSLDPCPPASSQKPRTNKTIRNRQRREKRKSKYTQSSLFFPIPPNPNQSTAQPKQTHKAVTPQLSRPPASKEPCVLTPSSSRLSNSPQRKNRRITNIRKQSTLQPIPSKIDIITGLNIPHPSTQPYDNNFRTANNPAETNNATQDPQAEHGSLLSSSTAPNSKQPNLKQATLNFNTPNKSSSNPPSPKCHTKENTTAASHKFKNQISTQNTNTTVSKPAKPLPGKHRPLREGAAMSIRKINNDKTYAAIDPLTNSYPAPHTSNYENPTKVILTKEQKAQLTRTRRIITRRNNQNRKNRLHPITNFLTIGGPQSRAIKRQPHNRSTKKYRPGNLFTCGRLFQNKNQRQSYDKGSTHLSQSQFLDTHEPFDPRPPPQFSQEPLTPLPSQPTQEEPIKDILHTHLYQEYKGSNTTQKDTSALTPATSPSYKPSESSDPVPLTILTLNLSKGGDKGLSLLDLEQIIKDETPDILLLTETPYASNSKTLTNLLKRLKYAYVYNPTPSPTPDQTHLPKEARLPKAAVVRSTGGALCAYKKGAPWANFVTHVTTSNPDITARVAAIKIQHPSGTPRVVAATYIPQKHPELQQEIWAYLRILPLIENIQYVLIGGDFQENIHCPKSKTRKQGLHPIRYTPSPTFCPSHAPHTNTTIDGFSTTDINDPWSAPSNARVSNIPTAYADHHALLLSIKDACFPNLDLPELAPIPAPPRLQLPLKPEYVSKWQLEVKQALTYQIQAIIKVAEDLLAKYPDHQDPFWTEPDTKMLVLRYAEQITDILTKAADKAYETMPTVPTRPPPQKSNQHKTRPRWSEQKMAEIKDAAQRTRLLRKFNNAGKHKKSKAYPLHKLISDLQTIPIIEEHAEALNMTPNLTSDPDNMTSEISEIIKNHKKYTKRIVASAKKENTQKYSEFLETLFERKPKTALETIIAAQKGKNKSQKLNLVKDVKTHKLYTQTNDCLTAITAEQTDNLSATVQHPSNKNYPWATEGCPDPITITPPPNLPTTLLDTITRADYDLCLKKCGKGKATGPDNIPGELIKSMPQDFHRALFSVFTLLARTRTTPNAWLQSKTVLIYKKGDPYIMDNYRPIALANHLYKIWTAMIAQILTEFVECNNILSDTQEGYRKGRSTNRAVAHLQLLLEDAHTHHKNLYVTYIDFKGAYPSVDHTQLRQVIQDLGIPQDMSDLIESLHKGAHTTFLTPHGPTPPIPIERGTLQGDPLSTILFDLMMEPLTRWLQSGNHGYKTGATGLTHEAILYADDIALTSKSIRGTQRQLNKIEQFGEWSHIKVNPSKCRTTGWVPGIQSIQKKTERDSALRNSLAHVTILGAHIPTLTQDEPLPGGYLGCQLTASLSPGAQKQWLNDTLKEARTAIQSAPVKIKTKIAMVQYLIYSKVRYTMGQMMYDYEFLSRMDGLIASIIKQAWGFPRYLPTAAVQSSVEDLGLDSPSLAMDYGATAAATLKDLLNDNGRLGQLARTSIMELAKEKQTWPKELILDSGIGFLTKAQALLQQAKTKIDGIPPSWQGNNLCDSLAKHILEAQPSPLHIGLEDSPPQYPPIRKILRRIKPLWSSGLTELNALLTPTTTTNAPPSLITYEDMQRQYPHIARHKGAEAALTYLTDLLTADSPDQFSNNRCRPKSATQPPRVIADRWLSGEAPLHVRHRATSEQPSCKLNNNQDRNFLHKTPETKTTRKRTRNGDSRKPLASTNKPHLHHTPPPPYPRRLTIHPSTHISTHSINPDRDALPTAAQPVYEAFLVPADQSTPQMVRVCDPQGKVVSPKDLTLDRYNFLAEQHATHSANRDFHLDLAELLRRYHPKARTQNPQGRPLDLKNHWALPQILMRHLMAWTGSPPTELFASPLNCLPDPQHTYYSAYQADAPFGARYNWFLYSWRGHCVANPEYEHEDMLKAMQHAIASANASPQPFSCVLVLPRWKDTPYRRQDILLHPNVKIVTGIEARHLKFVPADKEMAAPDPSQTSAHWAADIILVSNKAGFQTIDWPRVKKELPVVLRQTAGSPDFYVSWFPHPADLGCLKPDNSTTPEDTNGPQKQLTHTNLVQAADAPTPPPLDPAPFEEHHTWPASPNLQELPAFNIDKKTPLTVIELCAGIGTGLEALLKAGYTVGSYTWADINPDGHTVLQQTIPALHEQYKTQFPLAATRGWDTRLPFDINLITRELLIQNFPSGAHIVIAGPPCQPYSIAGKGKGLTDKRSSALLAVARTITHLARHQNQGVGYVIENVPGVKDFPEVLETLGTPVHADAPPCGSLAKRETLFWTNLQPTHTLQKKFNAIKDTPVKSLRAFLKQNGFQEWDVPYLVGHNRAPQRDKYNAIGRPLAILPKFVCHQTPEPTDAEGGMVVYSTETPLQYLVSRLKKW